MRSICTKSGEWKTIRRYVVTTRQLKKIRKRETRNNNDTVVLMTRREDVTHLTIVWIDHKKRRDTL